MALETLPDSFGDDTHRELDQAVNQEAADDLEPGAPLKVPGQCASLLTVIVNYSKGKLDSTYSHKQSAKELVNANAELREMLSSAWEHGGPYREIRNLAILKAPGQSSTVPLEILPDYLDDATHHKLDAAVNNDTKDLPPVLHHQHWMLLSKIIRHSNGEMDNIFLSTDEMGSLFNTHGAQLQELLSSAWKKKEYRTIRNLAILKVAEPATSTHNTGSLADDPDLSRPFRGKYRGVAVDGFHEYLTYNDKLFRETSMTTPPYYARFCSIVQSSGTGKSRMLTELSKKDCIVIYMNLRTEDDDAGFPPRDHIPAQILANNFPENRNTYATICNAFFIALFDTIHECLSKGDAADSIKAKSDIERWVDDMCDMTDPPRTSTRSNFFETLSEKYGRVYSDLAVAIHKRSEEMATSSAQNDGRNNIDVTDTMLGGTVRGLDKLSLSETQQKNAIDGASRRLNHSYKAVAAFLQVIFPNHSNEPKLVIAIDEAHPLTSYHHGYRPADVFCRVVKNYSHLDDRKHAVWVVFASTTSKVADFSPPNKIHNSNRIAQLGEKLFPPYTKLGWDQNATALNDVDVEDISKVAHIVGYGRALWQSLKDASVTSDMTLKTAAEKLRGAMYFIAKDTSHVLAVLGQRFGLNVTFGHPDSIEHLEKGVASHLRICLATTLDRTWRFTSYPSEPFLSCAAAYMLHSTPGNMDGALETLVNEVNRGMIEMGGRGELASRLLWLLAKDLFVRSWAQKENIGTGFPQTWDEHLIDCRMIPVVDWLEFVFGQSIWDGIEHARESFQNAYLNFSHWVTMDANISGSKAGDEVPMDVFTLRHWQRTSAVQCCHQQPAIDKIIPIYFKGEPGTGSAQSRVSQILISDRARKSNSSKNALHGIIRTSEQIASVQTSAEALSLPYIIILADLSWDQGLSATMATRSSPRDTVPSDPCLRIYAAGIHGTYAFLPQYPGVQKAIVTLVQLQQQPENQKRYADYLDAQMKFSSTAMTQHMSWEHGKMGPE